MEVKKPNQNQIDQWEYWNTFSVSKWCNLIQPFTFSTFFIPISVVQTEAIIKYQELILAEYLNSEELPAYNDRILDELEMKLDEMIKQFPEGAFVKMSDRSPKDAATERGRIQQHLTRFLQPIMRKEANSCLNNWEGLPAVYRAMMASLRVSSGKEALQLILVSFRTLEDLKERMLLKDFFWDLEIVVRYAGLFLFPDVILFLTSNREWKEYNILFEFRGFSCNNKLTALSQYYFDCYIEEIDLDQDAISNAIYSYWDQNIKAPLSQDYCSGYVIDFAYVPETGEVFVIELNPFDSSTDGAIFKWSLHDNLLRGLTQEKMTFKVIDKSGKKPETGKKSNWWIKLIRDWKKENNI